MTGGAIERIVFGKFRSGIIVRCCLVFDHIILNRWTGQFSSGDIVRCIQCCLEQQIDISQVNVKKSFFS